MAMANMNLIGVFVTKLWPVQALACGGGGDQKHTPEIFKFFFVRKTILSHCFHFMLFPTFKFCCC